MLIQIILLHGFDVCISIVRLNSYAIKLLSLQIIQTFELGLERGHEEVDIHYTVFITTKDPIHFVFKKR